MTEPIRTKVIEVNARRTSDQNLVAFTYSMLCRLMYPLDADAASSLISSHPGAEAFLRTVPAQDGTGGGNVESATPG